MCDSRKYQVDRSRRSRQAGSVEQTQTGTRRRTFSWIDPHVHAAHITGRGGVAALRALIEADLAPPVFQLLGMEGLEVDEGRVSVYLTPQEFHYNVLGSVHGGVLA